jgi:M-phase phosphoprotein-6
MQRSVLRIEQEKNAEEQQRAIDEEHWVLDLPELKQRE